METKKIYIVYSYGGEYEDKWDHVEYAFTSKESAQKYIDEQKKLGSNISDELFNEIVDYLAEKEWELQCKHYDPTTCKLIEGAKEEDYYADYDEFHEKTRYEIVKEKFNINRDDFEKKEFDIERDFVGYSIRETELYVD